MTLRRLSLALGIAFASLGLFAAATVAPVGATQIAVKPATARAVALVDAEECLDVAFSVDVTYVQRWPLVDVWGMASVSDISLDHADLSVSARPECSPSLDSVGAMAYVNSPVCDSGLCEGSYLTYQTPREDRGTSAQMRFSGPQALPDVGLVEAPWCLEFDAQVQYGKGDTGHTDAAEVEASDFCLDVS